MNSSDVKFFFVFVFLIVAAYVGIFHLDWGRYRFRVQTPNVPSLGSFTDGTPGSASIKEIQDENAGRAGAIGSQLP